MKTIRWGIVGLGRFGRVHAEAIQSMPGSSLTVICNRNAAKLNDAAAAFPDAVAVENDEDVLARADVDIISITSHWEQHYDIAKAALNAGKHVFLEKPMAATSAQCEELVSLAHSSSGFLMVGHICRFDPRAALAKSAIADGQIGQIVSMHAKRNLPKAPGHIRLDKISPLTGDGIHDADLMLWFMGQLPTRVYARNVSYSRHRYPDLGWAMLDFGSDAVGVIETIWCLPESVPTVIDARLEVIGTKGKLTVDCSQTGLTLTNDSGTKMSDTVYWPYIHGQRAGALVQELRYFADCVRSNRCPEIVTPEEAADAMLVIESAEMSAKSGLPVDIPRRKRHQKLS